MRSFYTSVTLILFVGSNLKNDVSNYCLKPKSVLSDYILFYVAMTRSESLVKQAMYVEVLTNVRIVLKHKSFGDTCPKARRVEPLA